MVNKANAIRAQDLWTRAFAEVGAEYPDMEQDHAYVDACCMWMAKNPEWFDVIVTTNLFGDIVTDLGAMAPGGIGRRLGQHSPRQTRHVRTDPRLGAKVHGQNVANPLGAIAAGMMLDFPGEKRAADCVEAAVASLLASRRIPSVDAKRGLSTTEIGDTVAAEVANSG